MTKEEYYEEVKKKILHCFPERGLKDWDDPFFQEVLADMYNDFSQYTPEQQIALIKSAGPEEPFWQRVVYDAVYVYHMC